ncbi:sugar transferase [Martelella mangrovi]|uniref:Lipopolysaccharide/colanic/teichoic acid biosynthesis glycosyltransferase n=1 Tax=Martelella mangrovi TaxID=1397477 RepID=A0ABV2I9H4_9HYPH|nr:sugar transferase [uncultured Martelella sp.]
MPRRAFGHELVFSGHYQRRKLQLALKRLFDIAISFGALAALSPLFLVIAILIRLDSPGPVFFSQVRWGRNGTKINIFKFRSMRNDLGDKSGVKQTVENDPRITKIGAFLRRTNIDELPQLFNVLRGDMSLIGPRCHAVGMLASGMLFEELVPEYHQRHVMRPGLSGLAQIRGWRGPTTRRGEARARIMCDLYYVSNYSFMLDMQILFATLRSEVGRGTGF